MRNKFIAAILVIIMVIPTIVAIVNYSKSQNGAADSHNTVSMEFTDVSDDKYSFERSNGEDDAEVIDFFLSMISSGETVGALPTTIALGDFYNTLLKTTTKEFGYKFYFTTSPEDCYYVDYNGDAYKISVAKSTEFLNGKYSASLFDNGSAPKLSASGNSVSPDTSRWFFKNVSEEYIEYDSSSVVKDEVETVSLEGGLTLNFTNNPDNFTVKVTDNNDGNVLFDDSYDNIANLLIEDSMNVKVEMSAKWFEDSARTYYGEQTYIFNATLTAPAAFYAGTTDIQIGEFICVTGKNVMNKENVTFTSEPSIDYTPVFYEVGDDVMTLIPFNWDLTAGSYVLTFSYGGSSQQININLANRDNPFGERTVTISDTILNSNGSAEALEKANVEIAKIGKSEEGAGEQHWNGEFLTGMGQSTIVGGFGHTFKVSGTDTTYRHTGVDYSSVAGAAVSAVNDGIVIYAGYLDYTGYMVVVEHGYGLKSWYYHMASNTVSVGDTVKKGDQVGTAGSTGFVSTTGAHVGLSVFDVPVCQYALWADGSRKGIPVYTK